MMGSKGKVKVTLMAPLANGLCGELVVCAERE